MTRIVFTTQVLAHSSSLNYILPASGAINIIYILICKTIVIPSVVHLKEDGVRPVILNLCRWIIMSTSHIDRSDVDTKQFSRRTESKLARHYS